MDGCRSGGVRGLCCAGSILAAGRQGRDLTRSRRNDAPEVGGDVWGCAACSGAGSDLPHPHDPDRFKAQFSVQEQVAIKRARAYVGEDEGKAFARDALDILFGSLDDPRLAEVDVNDPAVVGGIDFVTSLGILTAEREATIKLGAPTVAG